MVDFRIDAIVDPSSAVRGSAAVERGLRSASIAGAGLEKTVRSAFAAIGVGVGVREIITTADSFTNLENRLRTVIAAESDLVRVETELFDISQKTRTSYQANVEVFQRFTSATAALHVSQAELLGVIENLDKAVALSGATAIEATNALRQLTQGLGSGALKGDELRSVLEQLPTVADIIAKELNTTRGGLKKFGEQSQITTKVIVDAFEHAGPQLEKAFQNLVPTVGQSLITLGNAFLRLVGEINKGTGAFTALGGAIRFIADNLGTILTAAVGAASVGIATKLGGAIAGLIPVVATATKTTIALSAAEELLALNGLKVAATTAGSSSIFARLTSALLSSRVGLLGLAAVTVTVAKVAFESLNREVELTTQALDQLSAEGRGLHSVGDQIQNVRKELSILEGTNAGGTGQARTDSAAAARIAELTRRLKELDAVARQRATIGISDADQAEITKILDKLKEEGRIFGSTTREAAIQQVVFKELEHIKTKIAKDAVPFARSQIEEQARINQATKEYQDILNNVFGPAEKFKFGVEALNKAQDDGKVNVLQYRQEYARLSQEFNQSKLPVDAFEQLTASLRDQAAVLALQVQGREHEAEALREVQALHQQGRELDIGSQEQLAIQDQTNKSLERRVAILQEILGPQKDLILAQQDLNDLLQDGRINSDQFGVAMEQAFVKAEESGRKFSDGFERAIRKLRLESTDFASVAESAINTFADDATKALENFAETGKFALKDFARSLIADLTRIIARLLVVQALTAVLGGGAPAPSPGQLPFSFPGEERAQGGPVTGGRSYPVGERGPELFTPAGSGNISPAGSPALAPPQVNLQVVNVDDPNHVPSSINRGLADQAIINVLSRNRDRVNRALS